MLRANLFAEPFRCRHNHAWRAQIRQLAEATSCRQRRLLEIEVEGLIEVVE